jgi:hypothetical protein
MCQERSVTYVSGRSNPALQWFTLLLPLRLMSRINGPMWTNAKPKSMRSAHSATRIALDAFGSCSCPRQILRHTCKTLRLDRRRLRRPDGHHLQLRRPFQTAPRGSASNSGIRKVATVAGASPESPRTFASKWRVKEVYRKPSTISISTVVRCP